MAAQSGRPKPEPHRLLPGPDCRQLGVPCHARAVADRAVDRAIRRRRRRRRLRLLLSRPVRGHPEPDRVAAVVPAQPGPGAGNLVQPPAAIQPGRWQLDGGSIGQRQQPLHRESRRRNEPQLAGAAGRAGVGPARDRAAGIAAATPSKHRARELPQPDGLCAHFAATLRRLGSGQPERRAVRVQLDPVGHPGRRDHPRRHPDPLRPAAAALVPRRRHGQLRRCAVGAVSAHPGHRRPRGAVHGVVLRRDRGRVVQHPQADRPGAAAPDPPERLGVHGAGRPARPGPGAASRSAVGAGPGRRWCHPDRRLADRPQGHQPLRCQPRRLGDAAVPGPNGRPAVARRPRGDDAVGGLQGGARDRLQRLGPAGAGAPARRQPAVRTLARGRATWPLRGPARGRRDPVLCAPAADRSQGDCRVQPGGPGRLADPGR